MVVTWWYCCVSGSLSIGTCGICVVFSYFVSGFCFFGVCVVRGFKFTAFSAGHTCVWADAHANASCGFPRQCMRNVLLRVLGFTAAMAAPNLQTTAGPTFGDGTYQPNDMVTIHEVSNLEEGLRARVIAYDPDKSLYVVKDSKASIWGLRTEKLRPLQVLQVPDNDEWIEVADGVVVPKGLEISIDLETGRKRARRAQQQQQQPQQQQQQPTQPNQPQQQLQQQEQHLLVPIGGHHDAEAHDDLR